MSSFLSCHVPAAVNIKQAGYQAATWSISDPLSGLQALQKRAKLNFIKTSISKARQKALAKRAGLPEGIRKLTNLLSWVMSHAFRRGNMALRENILWPTGLIMRGLWKKNPKMYYSSIKGMIHSSFVWLWNAFDVYSFQDTQENSRTSFYNLLYCILGSDCIQLP